MTVEQESSAANPGEAGPQLSSDRAKRRAAVRPLLWRLHFLSGFLAAPVVLSLAITGILFAWNPQIEAALHREVLNPVADGPARSLAEQVTAARAERPGWDVTTVVPAAGEEHTTAVTLSPPGAGSARFGHAPGAETVYVDPASAVVTGTIIEADRPDEWLRTLHSSWQFGSVAEPVTELAASWVLVSLLTGLYLWWPRNRRALSRAVQLRRPGRLRWRSVHTLLGVGIIAAMLVMVGTGLTWTNYAGSWIDLARSQLQAPTPTVSTQLAAGGSTGAGSTAAGTGGHDSHAGQGDDDHSRAAAINSTTGVDQVAVAARNAGLTGYVELEPPDRPGQAWTATATDSQWPIERSSVAVDPATGQVTDRVDWDHYPLLAKATTLGIAFHQAELFGLANQIGLTLLAVALIVLIIAGYRMWWLRRPAGGLGVPPRVGPLLRTVPVPLLLGFGVLMVLLPTLGVSFLIYLVVERLIRPLRPRTEVHR